MSTTNFMDLTGSGSSSEMSLAMVSTLPSHVSTTLSHNSHHNNDVSDDEKTVAIVLACAFISLIVAWVSYRLYRMSRETRRRQDAYAARMVEEATVTVEASISNTASTDSAVEGAARAVEDTVASAVADTASTVEDTVASAVASTVADTVASAVADTVASAVEDTLRADVTNV